MLLHCWWEYRLIQPLYRTVWRFVNKLGTKLPYDPATTLPGIYLEKTTIKKHTWRWQKNRMGRPLSPRQIHQKNIPTLSKFYKTTSECWQRTSGTQKSRSLSSKTGRKNIKDEERDKGGREGALSREGSLKKREVSKHQETLSLPSLWRALEAQRAT